ncbi:uncharacterized protein LOC108676562 [Hyalella azteca]|uniref:Uncharacterized protein LOC108676562 n=1 Tax=Hyalella azteca TaxID=294128 RepID=A0A8B7P287_HYAAZ|nr:uncharacterized protein LOC108676562 [Hyalella azteca]
MWLWRLAALLVITRACFASESVSEEHIQFEEEHESSCAQDECVSCEVSTGRCLRCLRAILPSRRCVASCPTHLNPTLGALNPTLTAPTADNHGTICYHAAVGAQERAEFLRQLTALRKDAGLLLALLAETRARYRGLSGPQRDTKARAYRAVVRDLARVVALVGRPDESFTRVPADWRRLLAWAGRLLARYRRTAKVTGCQCGCGERKEEDVSKPETLSAPQPLFLTRQQTQEQRWRQQRLEADKMTDIGAKLYWTDGDFRSDSRSSQIEEQVGSSESGNRAPSLHGSPSPVEPEGNSEKNEGTACEGKFHTSYTSVNDEEISYSKDEEALAYKKAALFEIINEKSDLEAPVTGGEVNRNKKDRGSPGVISRIFCSKLMHNNTDSHNNNDFLNDDVVLDAEFTREMECLSSNSIYDHIEAFTFEDLTSPQKHDAKNSQPKPKQKNTANVNINRLRKPNFPGYSESFKQILDKRNLLSIQKNKIQKRLSKKGEQLNKIVRRTESRFLKDRNKINPNLTYDRRNVQNSVVNEEMVGGDLYVNVVKQPVIERRSDQTLNTYKSYSSLEETDVIDVNVHDVVNNSDPPVLDVEDNRTVKLRCEILTMV